MNARAMRVARGWVVGVFATALAALSHAVAGGGTPSPLALGVGVVFGGMLGTFALSARPSLPRLTITVALTQAVFHVVFSTLGSAAPVAGHAHDTLVMAQPVAHAHVDTPLMWLSHTLAGLLTLAVLRHAERALWRLLRGFVRLIAAPFRGVTIASATPRGIPVSPASPVRLLGRVLLSGVSRRGPPVSVAF
jgi:hypothetical protein